ncbi:MAG: inositol monophosphatase family protein, partial [Pseudomonadota bacterium]
SVSKTTDLAEATVMTTTPDLYKPPFEVRLAELEAQAKLSRYGFDCYAFAMLAAGHIDIVVEPGLQSYDIAGLIPLIEQAGGIVTTWDGERAEDGGNVIAAAMHELYRDAIAILNGTSAQ